MIGEIEEIPMTIRGLVHLCHQRAVDAGWHDEPSYDGTSIALMHSELSEALEGIRTDSMDKHIPHRPSVEVELADAVIRICDFCGRKGLDLQGAIADKLEYNLTREDHRPEARAKKGGKRF